MSDFCDIANHEANGSTIIRPKTNSTALVLKQYYFSLDTAHASRIDFLKQFLTDQGPITIALHGSFELLELNSGVFKCSSGSINHEVLLVGYTSSDDLNHPNAWIIKNSWGTYWGQKGFAYITMEYGIDCNISTYFGGILDLPELVTLPGYNIQMTGLNGWEGAEILISQPGKNDIIFGSNFMSGTQINLPVAIEGEIQVSALSAGNNPSAIGFTITDPNGDTIC